MRSAAVDLNHTRVLRQLSIWLAIAIMFLF
jgi:hypothetical protein